MIKLVIFKKYKAIGRGKRLLYIELIIKFLFPRRFDGAQ